MTTVAGKMKQSEESMRQYYCPVCGKRIFDAGTKDCATVTIKCAKCKQIVTVHIPDAESPKSVLRQA